MNTARAVVSPLVLALALALAPPAEAQPAPASRGARPAQVPPLQPKPPLPTLPARTLPAAPAQPPVASSGVPQALLDAVRDRLANGERATSAALSAEGGYVVTWGTNSFDAEGVPAALLTALNAARSRGEELRGVAFGPQKGSWVLLKANNRYEQSGLDLFRETLLEQSALDKGQMVALTLVPRATFIARTPKGFSYLNDTSRPLVEAMTALNAKASAVSAVAANGQGFVILYDGTQSIFRGIPEGLEAALNEMARLRGQHAAVALGPDGSYLLIGRN